MKQPSSKTHDNAVIKKTDISAKANTEFFPWIDYLRIISCLSIVVLHTSAEVINETTPNTFGWHMGNLYDASSRWGVPVFVLISGALLLDPLKSESLSRFYKKRVDRILIPLFSWSAIYLAYRFFWEKELNLRSAVFNIIIGKPYYHLWYIYMIPGLYLITPPLRTYIKASKSAERNQLTISLLAIFSLSSMFTSLYYSPPQSPSFLTSFVPYIPYFICGYQLRELNLEKLSLKYLLASIGISLSVTVIGSTVLVNQWGMTARGLILYDYLSPPVIVTSIAIFLLVMKLSRFNTWSFTLFPQTTYKFVASTTLGIYLIHPLILEILQRIGFSAMDFFPGVSIPIISLMIFTIALLFVTVLRAIPGMRRIIL